MADDIFKDIKEKAYTVCANYLGGIWKSIQMNELIIERLTGGFLNLTLKLSLPSYLKPISDEPNVVIMRNSLDMFQRGEFRQMTENIIVVLLAEKKLAPKVYGIFDIGRLDEYIPSRALVAKDLHNSDILIPIAKQVAQMHGLTLPISKDPSDYYKKIEDVLQLALNDPRNNNADPERLNVIKKVITLNAEDEFKWLLKQRDLVNSPIVYSHGDLQCNNILLRNNSDKPLICIIDHDLSGYNFRGHDIANLFNSFILDILYPYPPYYKLHWDQFPTLEEQTLFIRTYLEEFKIHSDPTIDMEKEIIKMLDEFKIFLLIYYFFAFLYCIGRVDIGGTGIRMNWIDLANGIIDLYLKVKNQWFDNKENISQ